MTGSVLATVAASGWRPNKEMRFSVSGRVCGIDATTRLMCQPTLYKRKVGQSQCGGVLRICFDDCLAPSSFFVELSETGVVSVAAATWPFAGASGSAGLEKAC